MKVVIYISVSTQFEAREGLSVAEQERHCTTHAIALGYKDTDKLEDSLVSATRKRVDQETRGRYCQLSS